MCKALAQSNLSKHRIEFKLGLFLSQQDAKQHVMKYVQKVSYLLNSSNVKKRYTPNVALQYHE